MICKVTVIFPKTDKWSEPEACYSRYKAMLTEKYGEPTVCVEKFQGDNIDDDHSKMLELKPDRCKYICSFSADNGDIELEMRHKDFACFVTLSYFDNVNQEKLKKKIMDEL